ncbi:MAG: DUF2079 domain-containing protein [Patescibacteria group bacterium]
MSSRFYLAAMIVLYIIAVFGVCLFKYFNYHYNCVDLAIFFQALNSLDHGNLLFVPIQGATYFADHFSLMFFIFYPIFHLWPSPVFLLFLQTIIIGLAAWPLYLIARRRLSAKKSLLAAALYLFNPFIIGMNLFEFHWLPFLFFFGFWLFYFYETRKNLLFIVFTILCLVVREDMGLFIWGMGAYIFYEQFRANGIKKAIKDKQVIWCFAAGLVWMLAAWMLIRFFNNESNKFLIYFQWRHDWQQAIAHFFNFKQLELLLQIFLPLGFIPLFNPRHYLMGAFYYLLLAAAFGSGVINIHYGAPLLIPGFIAVIKTLAEFESRKSHNRVAEMFRQIAVPTIIILLIYLQIVMGPFWGIKSAEQTARDSVGRISGLIESSKIGVAPSALYAPLSSGRQIYSLEKIYDGHQQFSQKKYEPPAVDFLIIDQSELAPLLLHERFYQAEGFSATGLANIKKFIAANDLRLKFSQGKFLLYTTDADSAQAGEDLINIRLSDAFASWFGNYFLLRQYKNDQKISEELVVAFEDEMFFKNDGGLNFSLTPVEAAGQLQLNKLQTAEVRLSAVRELGPEVFAN